MATAHPRQHYDKLTACALWVFTMISLALILVRLAWRYRRGEKFMKDDLWMAFSIAPLMIRLACTYTSIVLLTAYFNHRKYKQEFMSDQEIHHRTIGSITILPGRVCYAGFLWCMKASILGWFEKVTGMEKPYGALIRGAYGLLVVSFVGVVMSTFLECHPVHLYWQVWPDAGECVAAKTQLVTMGVLNIFTDLYLMAIPLPLVFRARLPLLRKVQLALLFSVSLFVVSITIIRMPIIVGEGILQKSRSLWASIEVMTACLVANAPVINSFVHSILHNHHQQQNPYSDISPASQRRRARMPVTGQDSFGSLTRNDGLDSAVESTGIEIPSTKEGFDREMAGGQSWSKEFTGLTYSANGGGQFLDRDFPVSPLAARTKPDRF